jgi:hypothetical protein
MAKVPLACVLPCPVSVASKSSACRVALVMRLVLPMVQAGAKVPEKLPLASSNAPIPSKTLLIALPAIVTPDALLPTIPVSDTGTPPFSAPLMWLLRMLRLVVSQNRMPVEVKLVGM